MKVLSLLMLVSMLHGTGADLCCGGCQCDKSVINCNNRNLSDIPRCSALGNTFHTLSIKHGNLTNPTLSNIPTGVINLDFSQNNIKTFNLASDNAAIKKLNLGKNKLTSVPNLQHFPNLIELDISGNPIPASGFGNEEMKILGAGLKTIHIGDANAFVTFPAKVSQHLQNLDTLDINGANPAFQYLPPNAFHAFASRLKNLTIRNTHLQAVPLTLRSAEHLQEFHFDKNPVGDFGILAESFTGLTMLKILTLRNDEITTFPEIVDHLSNLNTFALDGNQLLYIRENAFNMINASKIVDLSLANCSLDRIPGAVSSQAHNFLGKIQKLNFADNNIQSIDRNDLKNLASLTHVSFAGNPLQYISSDAFTGLPQLQSIDFSQTKLNSIPEAVKHATKLQSIFLNGTEVGCTCDLVDIKKWIDTCSTGTPLTFKGSCETISSDLQDYFDNYVTKCPLYATTDVKCT